jgi:hypothetical protein
MANPEIVGFEDNTIRGSAIPGGVPASNLKPVPVPEKPTSARVLFQNRLKPFLEGSGDMVSQAELSHDRRSIRLRVEPVFSTVTSGSKSSFHNPVIPGGR